MTDDKGVEESQAAVAAQSPVVLLVDDQPMVAEAIRRMLLSESDIQFHYCAEPKKAVQKAMDIKPSIILQDLVMPDIDGMTLVGLYRNNPATQSIPVMVLSSKEDASDKSDAFSRGATDYLVKLPDKIELIARIRAHSKTYFLQLERDVAFEQLKLLQKELEEKNAELALLSTQDGLTGIANRRCFDSFIKQEWARGTRNKDGLSLIMVDIDYFKPYNDHYGHQQGDECLRQVSEALNSKVCRSSDLVARYGGEEFVIVLPGTDSLEAKKIAEPVRQAVEDLKIKHERSNVAEYVTISMGVASMTPEQGLAMKDLIERADQALYQAKETGRNCIIVFEEM